MGTRATCVLRVCARVLGGREVRGFGPPTATRNGDPLSKVRIKIEVDKEKEISSRKLDRHMKPNRGRNVARLKCGKTKVL